MIHQSKFNSFLLRLLPVAKYTIVGTSMLPALKPGDTVLVNKLAYLFSPPKIGEIVILKDPRDKRIIIKRIEKIENGLYSVRGDNKKASTDSLEYGMLKKKNIIGKVIYKL